MKKINLKVFGALLIAGMLTVSCDKWINPDINENPDAPNKVTMSTLMPSIEVNMGYTNVGGTDAIMPSAIWLQQLAGVDRQAGSFDNYQFKSGDANNLWNTAYYTTMMDIKTLIDLATKENSPNTRGAAKILMANMLGVTTDLFGDIPFSEAFKGDLNQTPKFDSQEDIYTAIITLINEGLTDLAATDDLGISGDLIYDGDVDKWTAAAHALEARYTLHKTKRSATAWDDALTHVASAIAANADDMQLAFGSSATSANPFSQFMTERGDVRMGKFFVDLLDSFTDPRISVFAEKVGGVYVGSAAGESNTNASMPGPAIADQTTPVQFISYVEVLFIKAECLLKKASPDVAGAKTALKDAVAASLDKYGVTDNAYLTAFGVIVDGLNATDLYKAIMVEKYISLYYQLEAWNDWRRSDNVIGLVKNQFVTADFPLRYPYPVEEMTYNPNCPQNVKITDKLWIFN